MPRGVIRRTRVVGIGHQRVILTDDDHCNVRFRCMKCRAEVVCDAYSGPPVCECIGRNVMRPVSLCEVSPDAEDRRGTKKW